jgi:hypothetical protein
MSRISGTVGYDADADGLVELPTPHVRVTAEWPDGRVTTVESDAVGTFRFDTLLAGEYRLFIAARDVPPNTTPATAELVVLFDGVPFDSADFVLQPVTAGCVAQIVARIRTRHAAVVGAFCWDEAMLAEMAAEVLALCGLAEDGTLTPAQMSDLSVVAAVVVWQRVEEAAALGFDFEADDAAYKRSQLAAQASKMRVRAEERAWRLGICGFVAPVIEWGCVP